MTALPNEPSTIGRFLQEDAQELYEHAPGGHLSMLPDGTIIKVNATFLQWTGFTSEQLIDKKRFQHLLPVAGRIFYDTHFAPLLLMQGFAKELALELISADGTKLPVLLNSQLKRDAFGNPLVIRTVLLHASSRRAYEEELKLAKRKAEFAEDALRKLNDELELQVAKRTFELDRANKELETANKELTAFSYSVSHDLRSPLKTINGFSHLLERALGSEAGEKARHYLSRIRAGTGQMSELIDGLLTLAWLSRETLQCTEVDLSAIATQVAQGCKERDAHRQVHVQITEGMHATGDARLLSVVVENLLENAWKFTCKRDIAHIQVGCETDRAGKIVFFVKDDGAGFDMAHAEKLFGTFERLHSPSEFPGTGIGLATVNRVIERHAGRIWAQGKENEGAAFYFTLNEREA